MKGYTLIEVLVALVIFAILASITSGALYHAFQTRNRVNTQADELNQVQLAILRLEKDTAQMVDRAVYGSDMHLFSAFLGLPYYVEFTRGGVLNPLTSSPRSTLQRVAYLCKNNQLIRRAWDRTDSPNRKNYHDIILLTSLAQCRFSYLARNRQTFEEWRENALQQNQNREIFPTAIHVHWSRQNQDTINLLLVIPEALYAS